MDRAEHVSDLLDETGYAIVRGVLTPEEVGRIRSESNRVLDDRGLALAGGTVLPNAAVEAPELAWLFGHDALVRLARRALSTDDIMFTYEADLHRNYLAGAWHKDTGEQIMPGGYFGFDCFGRPDCRLVKLGIYLQEHVDGRGLRVRPGSHRSAEIEVGEVVPVELSPGDVVVFDVRISHCGARPVPADQLLRGVAKAVGRTGRGPSADSLRRRWNAMRHRQDRMAVFLAFGLHNDNTQAFATRNMRRQLQHLERRDLELPTELRDAYQASGVAIATI